VAAGDVFLSYVREDHRAVDRLQRVLESAGITVWRDTANLWPGEDWRIRIKRAITDNALVFIVCFSRNSVRRERSYQNEELILAIEQLRQRRPDEPWLIPVRFDDCAIPDLDIGGGRTLASIQRADLFGHEEVEGAERLVITVHRILSRSSGPVGSAHTEPTTKIAGAVSATEAEIRSQNAIAGQARRPADPTANAAIAVEDGESGLPIPPSLTRDFRRDSGAQPVRLLADAERLAQSILDKQSRARALLAVAKVLAGSDPDRTALLLSDALSDAGLGTSTYAEVLEMMATSDSERAERIARSITPPNTVALARIAGVIVALDPGRAERIARLITPRGDGAWQLVEVVSAMAPLDLSRAERLARSIQHEWAYIRALERIVDAVAISNPDEAERIAHSIPHEWSKAEALEELAAIVASVDPERAWRIAESISKTNLKVSALAIVARTMSESNSDFASRLVAEAEGATEAMKDKWWTSRWHKTMKASALAEVAAALTDLDPPREVRLVADAERAARSIIGKSRRAAALVDVAKRLADSNPAQSARIITDAAHTALSIKRWRAVSRDSALMAVAKVAAASDPELAERLAQSIADPREIGFVDIARAIAASDPERAASVAKLTLWAGPMADGLGEIAAISAASSPDQGERIAQSITKASKLHDLRYESELALARVAEVTVHVDPDRAERIAQSITAEEIRVKALAAIAKAMLRR
jgi:TIR domain